MGSGPSPLSCGVFLPTPLLQAFPLLVAGRVQLVRDSPPLLFGAQGAPPSLLHVFFVVIVYYSVSLFALGGGLCVQGAMLIWHRVVCVSTVYHLAHLVVCIFPIHLGCGPGALLFSLFNMKWRWSMQAGGVEDQIFASSQWFFL
jgi:hypothetical protein